MTALSACDVAIITSTSIINNTVDGLLAALKGNRAAVMLAQVFFGTNPILDLNFSSNSYLMQPRLIIRYNILLLLLFTESLLLFNLMRNPIFLPKNI
jgi:uncharacterized protein (DUF4213/DUF364 family)